MNDVRIEYEPPFSLLALASCLVAVVCVWIVLRLLTGRSLEVSRRWGLIALRLSTLALLATLLINPVLRRETTGQKNLADVFYLMDSSQSMAVGDNGTRWERGLQIIRDSQFENDEPLANLSLFRFGQRLAAVDLAALKSPPTDFAATDSDTQLAAALRQMTSRFGRTPPAGVVIFSDGRARDAAELDKVAAHYAQIKVPLHVVPIGEAGKGGDLAIVGVVSPPKVRKNSQVEVRVFLRSYGYDDKRCELLLTSVDRQGNRRKLNNIPITVRSGIQSFTTSYQSGDVSQKVEVAVSPLPGEMSVENNRYSFDVAIDRTKIRILYVEGGAQLSFSFNAGTPAINRGAHTDLQNALTADPDIECVVLSSRPGSRKLERLSDGQGSGFNRSFPETIAELAAFDAIIISNTARRAFTETQLDWIEQWIEKRGGGLCMIGGPNSFAAGGWKDEVIDRMLPVELSDPTSEWSTAGGIKLIPNPSLWNHPIWHFVENEKANRDILAAIPAVTGLHQGQQPKSSANALVLASVEDKGVSQPVITAGAYGKGRTLSIAVPTAPPWANEFVSNWGEGDQRYYAKFWRNVVYWLTEDSSIGRRRLIAKADQPFYRPTEKITLTSGAYDESANRTASYRIVAMVEPQGTLSDSEQETSPIRWPDSIQRTSGETGPYIAWGEEFELPRVKGEMDYRLELLLGPAPAAASATQSIRLELTAYEDTTQVDSTSIDLRIVHDPYEQQNPFPEHDQLLKVANAANGKILKDAQSIREMLKTLPVPPRASVVRTSPWWDQWWILGSVLGMLTIEWFWRRNLGLG